MIFNKIKKKNNTVLHTESYEEEYLFWITSYGLCKNTWSQQI